MKAFARLLWEITTLVALSGCAATQESSVSLVVVRQASSPRDAAVYVDERFVGLLGVVAARGIRLPAGKHLVTIERNGYFPWDALIEGQDHAIRLEVELTPIPD